MKPFPYLTLGAGASTLVASLSPDVLETLQWDRLALAQGEVWRLATAHVTHFTPSHLVWDLALFLIMGVWVERRSRRAWLATVGVSALCISIGLLWLSPELLYYRGLSGIDSALFAWAAVDVARLGWRARRWGVVGIGAGAFAALVGKASYEAVTGLLFFVQPDSSFIPVPWAHAVGALCGAAVAGGLKRGDVPVSPCPQVSTRQGGRWC